MFNRFLKVAAVTGALILSCQANASYVSLSDDLTWGINSSGGGLTSGYVIETDTLGFTQTSYTDSSLDMTTFSNYGYLEASSYSLDGALYSASSWDEYVQLNDYSITAEYSDWEGTYTSYEPSDDDEVNFTIDEGTITWYSTDSSDNSVVILEATIVDSSGDLNLSGDENGQMNVTFEITYAAAGYFYIDLDDDGFEEEEDLSTLLALADADGSTLYFGYSSSFNQITDLEADNADTASLLEILLSAGVISQDEYDGYYTDISNGDTASAQAFIDSLADTFGDEYTSGSGTYTMNTIPEPGMLSLMGLAFLGMAGFQRRRKNS